MNIIDVNRTAEQKFNTRAAYGNELMDWVDAIARGEIKVRSDFVNSVVGKYDMYGDLTAKQAQALRNIKKLPYSSAPVTPVPEGRTSFGAIVRKAEYRDTDFGPAIKLMLVSDDGWRAWGNAAKPMWDVARSSLIFGDSYGEATQRPVLADNVLCEGCLEFECECSGVTQIDKTNHEPTMEAIAEWFVGKRFNVTANLKPQDAGFAWFDRAKMKVA